jgi:hypothetical protein
LAATGASLHRRGFEIAGSVINRTVECGPRGQIAILTGSSKTAPFVRTSSMATSFLAVVHDHADSVIALRIVFSIGLAIVFFAGLYVLRIRKRLFDRDPEVTGDHYGARNLRLWQVILVWILAMDLLIMALWKV